MVGSAGVRSGPAGVVSVKVSAATRNRTSSPGPQPVHPVSEQGVGVRGQELEVRGRGLETGQTLEARHQGLEGLWLESRDFGLDETEKWTDVRSQATSQSTNVQGHSHP